MVNRERKVVMKYKEGAYFDYCTLESIVADLTEAIAKYGPGAEVREHREPYDDCDRLAIFANTTETDAEMEARIKEEESQERRQEARDAAEYARLQAKFAKAKENLE